MKTVHNIIEVGREQFPDSGNHGWTAGVDGEEFRFLTNFSGPQLLLYMKAVETYEGPEEFGIAEDAYGRMCEDTGQAGRKILGYYGFYVRGIVAGDLSSFWHHFRQTRITYHFKE